MHIKAQTKQNQATNPAVFVAKRCDALRDSICGASSDSSSDFSPSLEFLLPLFAFTASPTGSSSPTILRFRRPAGATGGVKTWGEGESALMEGVVIESVGMLSLR